MLKGEKMIDVYGLS